MELLPLAGIQRARVKIPAAPGAQTKMLYFPTLSDRKPATRRPKRLKGGC